MQLIFNYQNCFDDLKILFFEYHLFLFCDENGTTTLALDLKCF